MLDKTSADLIAFDWAKTPTNPKTKEEHAYVSGMVIQRLRSFIFDDGATELVNFGAGPRERIPDLATLEVKDGVGPFGMFVALEPDDLDLYRRLLPEHFEMPARPVVSLVTVDYNQPNPIVRYNEGMVMLKAVAADGTDTWYVHSMPVETWLMLIMGHDWGFRKEIFNIEVSRGKTVVNRPDGTFYMSLELTDQAYDEASAIVPDGGSWGINNMAVVHPVRQDHVLVFASGTARALEQQRQMVRIRVNPNEPWAGLVADEATAPGVFQRYISVGDATLRKIVNP